MYCVSTLFTHNAFSIFFSVFFSACTRYVRVCGALSTQKFNPKTYVRHLLLFKGQTSSSIDMRAKRHNVLSRRDVNRYCRKIVTIVTTLSKHILKRINETLKREGELCRKVKIQFRPALCSVVDLLIFRQLPSK